MAFLSHPGSKPTEKNTRRILLLINAGWGRNANGAGDAAPFSSRGVGRRRERAGEVYLDRRPRCNLNGGAEWESPFLFPFDPTASAGGPGGRSCRAA
jgi:hypothetical protein